MFMKKEQEEHPSGDFQVKTSCCGHSAVPVKDENGHCHAESTQTDWMFRVTSIAVALAVLAHLSGLFGDHSRIGHFSASVAELLKSMWWGAAIGIVFIGLLSRVPRDMVMSVLGTQDGLRGIWRATLAGVMLDLCSHGILMVGSKLYERGASIGQVMAFLIASPWNSFSLTLILWSLIGLKWTLTFLVLSMAIGIVSGLIFDVLVRKGTLPGNPNRAPVKEDFRFWPEFKKLLSRISFKPADVLGLLKDGALESRMVLRWMFLGVILAALIRVLVPAELFTVYFGATGLGLFLTMFFATVLEVCSEGSTPIAADILTRAGAVGNSFAFLMTGVSTDYTEIMVLRGVTKSWKIALFLPLVTVPQVLVLALVLNQFR